jgi:hypothetical protein
MKSIAVTTATPGYAKGTITSNGTIPTDGDTVTIGNKTYTAKTTLTPTEGQVLINGSAANFLINLKRAIDHTGTPDTDYKCAAAHTQVAGGTITTTTLQVTALTIGLGSESIATTDTAATLSWGATTLAVSDLTIVATFAEETFSQPSQRVTVGEFPPANTSWSRAHRLTNDAHFCERNLSSGVVRIAWPLDEFAKVALALEPAISWAPKITTEPSADTTSFATALLTSNGTAPANNDQVAIGDITYVFKTTLTGSPDEVLIGASAAAALDNLKSAVNTTAGEGTTYGTGTATNTLVTATTNTDTTQLFVSKAVGTSANSITSTETSANLSFGGTTMSGATAAATFAVVAVSETDTLTYVWQYSADGSTGWTAASGTVNGCVYTNNTTATLTCTPTTTGQTGYYHRCIVTNAAGSTTSESVILTIT